MRLIIDMNLSPRWTDALANRGNEALHWSTLGAADARDSEIMAMAKERGDAVLTHDLDFGSILAATGADAPSVLQLRLGELAPEIALDAVTAALAQFNEELLRGALVTIDARRSRVSLLPLRH